MRGLCSSTVSLVGPSRAHSERHPGRKGATGVAYRQSLTHTVSCILGSEWQANRRHDFIGQRLTLLVPQRKQETDVADDRVDKVRNLPHQRHTESQRLAGGLADHLELHDRFADAGSGSALLLAG